MWEVMATLWKSTFFKECLDITNVNKIQRIFSISSFINSLFCPGDENENNYLKIIELHISKKRLETIGNSQK